MVLGGRFPTPSQLWQHETLNYSWMLSDYHPQLSHKERQFIESGSVFVWDEKETGMRRWIDGKSWSASRGSGSFLIYKQMESKRGARQISNTLD